MSESGIMHNLMRQIESKARDREAERVVRVTLRVGALADVTEARLREQFANHCAVARSLDPFGDLQEIPAQRAFSPRVQLADVHPALAARPA